MTLRTTLLSTAFLGLAPFAVSAGGLNEPVMEPAPMVAIAPMARTSAWDGFYLGGQIGTGDVNVSNTGGGDLNFDINSYGLHAGYMRSVGTFVLGAEVDYDFVTVDTSSVGGPSDGDASLAHLKFRAGYDAGRFLPYLTVGAAFLHDDVNDQSDTGIAYGLGAVYAVTDKILVGGEYMRNTFDDFDSTGVNVDVDQFSLRVSYKF